MFHLASECIYISIKPINSLLKILCMIFSEKDQAALVMYKKLSNTFILTFLLNYLLQYVAKPNLLKYHTSQFFTIEEDITELLIYLLHFCFKESWFQIYYLFRHTRACVCVSMCVSLYHLSISSSHFQSIQLNDQIDILCHGFLAIVYVGKIATNDIDQQIKLKLIILFQCAK